MIKWERLRPGQRRAIQVIIQKYKEGKRYVSIVIATRYGKTDVMRIAAYLLKKQKLLPCAVVLSPSDYLRGQIVNLDKWRESFERYEISDSDILIRELKDIKARPNQNGELLISATTQLVERNVDIFKQWVEWVVDKTGQRPIVFVDECHTGSESNSWGEAVKILVEAGAVCVLLTATPIRHDGKRIPGFSYEVIEEQPVTVTKFKNGSAPELVKVEKWEGVKQALRLIPDHETTFRQAWEENVICKVGYLPFDVDLSRIEGEEVQKGVMLSSLEKEQEARRALGKCVRSPIVVEEACRRFVSNLDKFQALYPDAAGIIFGGNDREEDEEDNAHLEFIKDILVGIRSDLKDQIVIATSANTGKEILEDFVNKGNGKILLVKQMASVGLDAPRLKVGLDLSTIKSLGAYIQRMMRIATVWGQVKHCVWITLADVVSRTAFASVVMENGGCAKSLDIELVESWEQEKPEERDKPFYGVDGTLDYDFEDSASNHADYTKRNVVEAVLDAFPVLVSTLSHAEIAEKVDRFGLVVTDRPTEDEKPQDGIRDTSADERSVKTNINEAVDDLVKRINAHEGKKGVDAFVACRKRAFTWLYKRCGVPYGIKFENISDLALLQKMYETIDKKRKDYGKKKANVEEQATCSV